MAKPGTWRRRLKLAAAAATILFLVLFFLWNRAIRNNRAMPDEPFRIAGNLYYVGNAGVTSFLIAGPEGHVLIDGGYPESPAAIIASITKLGFDVHDVKAILNTHAHADHAGGLRALKEATGAQIWISESDTPIIESGSGNDPAMGRLRFITTLFGRFPGAHVDHRVKDGQILRVGPIELTAHVTAGHTRGCTSWSFPVRDGDRRLLAVDVCSLTLFPFVSLVEPEAYPGIRNDFERSFVTLRALPADLFLASHADMFAMNRKRAARVTAANPADPFIDRAGYLAYIEGAERNFRRTLAEQKR